MCGKLIFRMLVVQQSFLCENFKPHVCKCYILTFLSHKYLNNYRVFLNNKNRPRNVFLIFYRVFIVNCILYQTVHQTYVQSWMICIEKKPINSNYLRRYTIISNNKRTLEWISSNDLGSKYYMIKTRISLYFIESIFLII